MTESKNAQTKYKLFMITVNALKIEDLKFCGFLIECNYVNGKLIQRFLFSTKHFFNLLTLPVTYCYLAPSYYDQIIGTLRVCHNCMELYILISLK